MQEGRVPRCVSPLLSPNRSSLNLLHSVKNRAPAAIQVRSSSLQLILVLIISLSFRSPQNSYSEKYEHNIHHYSSLTPISRLKNDKNPSSAHPGSVSKTLRNFMNIVVVNVKSSKNAFVALEVACQFFSPSPSAAHLFLS